MAVFRLGCCISAHGFGHAARTAAVVQELAAVLCAEFMAAFLGGHQRNG